LQRLTNNNQHIMKFTRIVRVLCIFIFCSLAFVSYAQVEDCNNGIDDDGDGLVDCNDPDCSGFAVPVSTFFHTGKNGNGGILGSGAQDLDWDVSINGMGGPYNPAIVLGAPATNPYAPSPWPDAQWISTNVNASDNGQFMVGGLYRYYYRIQFYLPCSDACGNNISANFCINMSFMADNSVTNIFVNGVAQPAVANMNPPNPGGFVGFQLANAANINMCNNFQPGLNTITIEVTSGGGLAAFCAQTNVNAPPLPVNPTINPIIGGVNGVICNNQGAVPVTADIAGGSWSASCAGCIDPVTGMFDPVASGAGTFDLYYSVQSGNVCGSDTATVNVLPAPQVDAGPDQGICPQQNVTLAASGAQTYAWDNGINDNVPFIPAATLSYTVIGTAANQCTDTDQVTVTVYPLPNASAGADVQVCAGSQVTLTGAGPNPVWDNGITDGVPFIPPGSGVYTLTVSDNNNCQASDQVNVTVIPVPPAPPLAIPAPLCQGEAFLIDMPSLPGVSYVWTLPSGQQQQSEDVTIAALQMSDAGNYSVFVVFQGCTSAVSTQALVVLPLSQGVWQYQMCQGETYLYQGQTYTQSGVYPVVLQGANGCDSTVALSIVVTPMPQAGFNAPDRVSADAAEMSVTDASQNASGVVYTLSNGLVFNTPDFSYTFPFEGTYQLLQVAYNGTCIDSVSQIIMVEPAPQVFIPNAFTPGKDDLNSEWKPVMSYLENYSLTIFSRWGEQVFRSSDVYKGWNGGWFNNADKPAESGTYVYRIDYKEYQGKNKQLIGHIILLR